MARTIPCPACRKKVSAKAPTCLKCGHPLADDTKFQKRAKSHGSPITLAVVMVGTLGGLIAMGGWARSQKRSVFFTYRQPGIHVLDRCYYEVGAG